MHVFRLAFSTLAAATLISASHLPAQTGGSGVTPSAYWQQRADYVIRATLDPGTHRYRGQQTITYTNHSPDTLTQLFFHLYNNAFQPGSAMDERSRSLPDPDGRVGDRIAKLSASEQGFLHVTSLRVDGRSEGIDEQGTIGQVELTQPLLPGARAELTLEFEGQVPVQIRRNGRNNAEGVDYSMSQWYPKLSEYDADGWHPNPYVGREFYGVWGDFDVTIGLPAAFKFAGTGYPADVNTAANAAYFVLAKAETAPEPEPSGKRRGRKGQKAEAAPVQPGAGLQLHRRLAPMVHDFTWAADTEYRIDTLQRRSDGVRLEAAYIPGPKTTENWALLLPIMDEAMSFANEHYGQYPYRKYAFIQGGDGGMEYAMCTLITGERNLNSLVGVSVHEMMHSWYQFVLATDEAQYPWMDEGFTSYASAEIMAHLQRKGLLPGSAPEPNVHAPTALGYARFVNAGRAEPLSTHADHYTTNAAYGTGSYSKGELFLHQLRTVIGEQAFDRGMLRYYDTWKMRHPTPRDFIRIMERESGQVLDWYLDYMVNTTHQIDYAVDSVRASAKSSTAIALRRDGRMPFPLTVDVYLKDGKRQRYLIPLDLQRGHAPLDGRELLPVWTWTNPRYEFELPVAIGEVSRVVLNETVDHSEARNVDDEWPRTAVE